MNKYNLLLQCIIFSGVICNLFACTEKEADSFLDSLSENHWLSSAMSSNHEKIAPKRNDDLYKAIRKKLIKTLENRRIHRVTYTSYADDQEIVTIHDHDATSVEIKLVNTEIITTADKLGSTCHLNSFDIVTEWNNGKVPLGIISKATRSEKVHEGLLQLRVKSLVGACFLYENRKESLSILSLKKKNLITSNQATMAGVYNDYHVAQSICSFFKEHLVDWSRKNKVVFASWGLRHENFEEYYKSDFGAQSRLRWTNLIK